MYLRIDTSAIRINLGLQHGPIGTPVVLIAVALSAFGCARYPVGKYFNLI